MATYYCDWNSGNDSNDGSSGSPWKRIQKAVDTVSAGDIIKVRNNGTYEENINWSSKSGTSGSPIILEADNSNSRPTISGNEAYPSPKDPYQIDIQNSSHIIVNGFQFRNAWGAGGIRIERSSAGESSDVTIQNCHFEDIGHTTGDSSPDRYIIYVKTFQGAGVSASATKFLRRIHILGCTFKHVRTGDGNGSYHEVCTFNGQVYESSIQNCRIDDGSYIGFDLKGAWYRYSGSSGVYGYPQRCVMRGNEVVSLIADDGYNRNGLYCDRGGYRQVLLEQNFVRAGSKGVHMACEHDWNYNWSPGDHYIVRNNAIKCQKPMIDGPGSNHYGQGESNLTTYDYIKRGRIAHNYFHTEPSSGARANMSTSSEDIQYKNNVFHLTDGLGEMIRAGMYAHDYSSGKFWEGNMFNKSNTNYYPTKDAAYSSFSAFESSSFSRGNKVATSICENKSGAKEYYDFRLASNSPGYGEAVALTTAKESKISSKTLKVNDARWFFDGWGIYGYYRDAGSTSVFQEAGDRIVIDGQDRVIASINYGTNTITLTESATWSAGDGVYYAYDGSPSIGVGLPVATTLDIDPGTPEPPPPPELPEPGTVLNSNADFTSDLTSWEGYSSAGDYAWTSPANTAVATGTTPGSWSTQLLQSGLELISGETYTVRMKASSTVAVAVNFGVIGHVDPWPTYGSADINLTTTSTTYEFTFVAPENQSNARLRFNILEGDSGTKVVTIDELKLIFGDSTSSTVKPTITSQPASVTAVDGDDGITFSIAASGTAPSYQWYENGAALYNGGDISGAQSTTLTLDNVAVGDNGNEYHCIASNSAGQAISNTATLTVNAATTPGNPTDSFVDEPVGTSHDDSYMSTTDINFYWEGDTAYVGDVSSNAFAQQFGALIEIPSGKSIPNGATVTSATFDIYANGNAAGAFAFKIRLEDMSDASTWVDRTDALGRALTSGVDWTPTLTTSYATYESADFSGLVQALVDKYGGLEEGEKIGIRLQPATLSSSFGSANFARVRTFDYNSASNPLTLSIAWESGTDLAVQDGASPHGMRFGMRTGF